MRRDRFNPNRCRWCVARGLKQLPATMVVKRVWTWRICDDCAELPMWQDAKLLRRLPEAK